MSGPRLSLEEIAELLAPQGARQHGATAADVVVAEGDSLMVGVRLGEVEKVQRSRAKHLGMRAFVGDRSAITSTADFSPTSLDGLPADARGAGARHRRRPVQRPSRRQRPGRRHLPELDLYDPAIGEVTAEQATEWCRAGEAAALDVRRAHHQLRRRRVRRRQPPRRLRRQQRLSRLLPRAPAVRSPWCRLRRRTAPCSATTGTACSATCEARGPPADRPQGRRARAAPARRRARSATSEVPVVFDPDMAASLLRHLAGAVSGNALYKGMSFLTGKLGERVAPEFVTRLRRRPAARRPRIQALRRRGSARRGARPWSRAAC